MSELKYEDLDSVIKNADSSLVQLLAIQLKKSMEDLQKSEDSESQLIDERDHAEGAIADMYNAAIGRQPEWSNWFGFSDAVTEVGGEVYALRQKISKSEKLLNGVPDEAIAGGWTAKGLSDYAISIQQQLTATTNSLTNAQEALKSAGIEADTVQAGVMELVNRMNQVVAEMSVVEAIHDECVFITDDDYDACPKSVQKIIRSLAVMKIPATDAYLNAVRAEGVEMLVAQKMAEAKRYDSNLSREIAIAATVFANKLRAGNAGKDGV